MLKKFRLDKGKGKAKEVYSSDKANDDDDYDDEQPVIKVRHDGKKKSQALALTQQEKKCAMLENSGVPRKPACRRCLKAGKKCFKQSGPGAACFLCATMKMRCEPPSGEESDPAPTPSIPAKCPASENMDALPKK